VPPRLIAVILPMWCWVATMADYTIRYLRPDGGVSMYFRPNCFSDADAWRQAASHMRPEFARAEVWKDLDCLAVLTTLLPLDESVSPPRAA